MSFKKLLKSLTLAIALIAASFSATYAGVPASLLLPTNNTTCNPENLALRWQSSTGKISNNVWVSTKSDFTENVQFYSNILVDTLNLNGLTFNKTFYWKVVTYFGATDSATTGVNNFTVKTPFAYPTAPALNLFGAPLTNNFQWVVPQEGTFKYKLEISESNTFPAAGTIVYDTISTNSKSVDLPKYNTRYFWRVTVYNATGCASTPSSIFTLRTKPAPVALLAPLDKSKGAPLFGSTPFNFTMKWNKNLATPTYQVQLADLRTFAQPLFDTTGVVDTTIFVANKLPNTNNRTYYWRVRAIYNNDSLVNCATDWSNIFEFKTPYVKTTILNPVNNATCTPLSTTFSWNRVDTLAQSYFLQLSSNTNFTDTLQQTLTGKDTTFLLNIEKPQFVYYARLRLDDANNTSVWSDVVKFTTTIAVPAMIGPADLTKGALRQTTFKWNDFDTNAIYKLQVSETNDFATTVLNKDSIKVGTYAFTLPNYNKTYYWRYMATLGSCSSVWSNVYSIKTIMAAPVLLTPTDTTKGTDLSLNLTWSKVETATYYEYMYDTTSTFAQPIGLTAVSSLTVRISNLLENRKYYWTVRAVTPEGKTEWATPFTFTTNYKLPEKPVLLKPANSTYMVPINVNLVWAKTDRALTYDVQVTEGVDFSKLAYEGKDLTDTTYALKGLKNYVNYKWRVRAKGLGGYSAWSDFFFRTIALPPSTQPALVVPAENSKDLASNVSFNWLPATGAEFYELQIAKDKGFATGDIIKDIKKIWSTPEGVYDLPMSSTLYWRVRGGNEAGDGPWSIIRTFSTAYDAGVDELTANNFSVYPNPVQNSLNFNFNSNNFQVTVVDALGLEVAKIEGFDKGALNVSELPQGSYFFTAKVGYKTLKGSFVISR